MRHIVISESSLRGVAERNLRHGYYIICIIYNTIYIYYANMINHGRIILVFIFPDKQMAV